MTTAEATLGPLAGWDVSQVDDMAWLFSDMTSYNYAYDLVSGSFDNFNGDVSEWDVARVTTLNNAFKSADSFNGDLSKWDTARTTTFGLMVSVTPSPTPRRRRRPHRPPRPPPPLAATTQPEAAGWARGQRRGRRRGRRRPC